MSQYCVSEAFHFSFKYNMSLTSRVQKGRDFGSRGGLFEILARVLFVICHCLPMESAAKFNNKEANAMSKKDLFTYFHIFEKYGNLFLLIYTVLISLILLQQRVKKFDTKYGRYRDSNTGKSYCAVRFFLLTYKRCISAARIF